MRLNFISFSSCIFFLLFSNLKIFSQVDNTGCVLGNFGIDADLYSGALPYGDHTPATPGGTDDWFFGATGKGVIDTANAAAIRTGLQGAGDYTYEARMNGNLGAIIDGRTWFDAVYARDNFGGTGFVDPTAFPVSSKNTQPPTSWSAGPANVLGKNDLLDVGAHLRRLGTAINSPLILTGLISRAEPGGAAYMDMEFFVENVSYTPGVGFSSAGPDLGHRGFRFNANGTLAQMGDMLVNISLNSGGTQADLEMRIWVKRADRAKSSAEYIKQKISNPERISGKGYGETKLLNGCACEGAVKSKCTEAEHQANRRTEFIILKIE